MNKLYQLAIDNKAAKRTFAVNAEGDVGTIYLYDVIGDYGVEAKDIVQAIAGLKGKPVALRINSPGGDVFAGRAMATAIAQHGNVTAYIDGLAASAATYVALAANRVVMAEGSLFMVHNAWTIAFGNKNDLLETAALLEKIDQSIVNDYAKKTGKDAEQIAAWMDAETWFDAKEALEHGFVDEISEPVSVGNNWNLSAYANAPVIEHKAEEDDGTEARNRNRLRLYEIE